MTIINYKIYSKMIIRIYNNACMYICMYIVYEEKNHTDLHMVKNDL